MFLVSDTPIAMMATHLKGKKNIAIPTTENYEKYGMEDPRITKIQNKIIITYVVLTDYVTKQPKVSSALAITPDYVNFKKLGILTDYIEENKDVVFFAEKLNSNNGDGGSFHYTVRANG
jgi:predicted GH43/DUF377 family glycosyl hydrolase